MKLKTFFRIAVAAGVLLGQSPVWSAGPLVSCKDVIAQQEAQKGIPQDLLKAIAKVESGISPWAVNARGRSYIFRSKEAAAKYVRELVGEGVTNFSVGCMQLHYASHRRHFKSVEAMLEPANNIAHAAKFIKNLERRYGSMERAVKLYHSASPTHHNRYQKRVYGMWAKFRRPKKDTPLKTVALQKITPQKSFVKAPKRTSKIKFGVGAVSANQSKNQKI